MYNVIMLSGRLAREPELVEKDNVKYSQITLAVQRPFKNSEGVYETDFLNIKLWNGVAERVSEYMKKGNMMNIIGRLQNNNYVDKNGEKVYSNEIIADKVAFLSKEYKEKDAEDKESR